VLHIFAQQCISIHQDCINIRYINLSGRHLRHQAIKKLIKANRIESQEAMLECLKREGVSVTQATLSRDLKFLRIGKLSDGGTGYYYVAANGENSRESARDFVQGLIQGWISIDFSGNIGVVKTRPGHANAVAIALDNLGIWELLGTVAGDDTVILVLGERAERENFMHQLVDLVPEIG
jgi:transcriptional regulator of arginine metabolism